MDGTDRDRERAAAVGGPAERASHLRARVRRGDLASDRLRLAAYLGDEASQLIVFSDHEGAAWPSYTYSFSRFVRGIFEHPWTDCRIDETGRDSRWREVAARVAVVLAGWICSVREGYCEKEHCPDECARHLAASDTFEQWTIDGCPQRPSLGAVKLDRATVRYMGARHWGRWLAFVAFRDYRTGIDGLVRAAMPSMLGTAAGADLSRIEAIRSTREGEHQRVRILIREHVVPWLLGEGDPIRERLGVDGFIEEVLADPACRRALAP